MDTAYTAMTALSGRSLRGNDSGRPEVCRCGRSTHRRCVLQTTLVPQGIETTLDLQLAASTDVATDATGLVEHLNDLHGKLKDIKLTPQGLLDGTVRLAYEVGESKADGGESRISGTSLDDMRNNIAGIDFAYHTIFSAALNTVDGKLDEMVTNRIEQLQAIVATPDLPHVNIADLRRTSEELVVALQSAAAKLGLQRPTLEAQAR